MKNIVSFAYINALAMRYVKEFAIGLILIGLGLAAGYGFWLYRIHQDEAAQVAFATCLEELKQAQNDPSLWPTVALASISGYRQHNGSSVAPYFLAVEAQALLNQGKTTEAIESLNKMMNLLSETSPLYFVYAMQRARMKLDSDAQEIKNAGLHELEILASNKKNKNRDEALYYLGQHYDDQALEEKAKEKYHQLVVDFPEGGLAASPWAMLAKEKLKTDVA